MPLGIGQNQLVAILPANRPAAAVEIKDRRARRRGAIDADDGDAHGREPTGEENIMSLILAQQISSYAAYLHGSVNSFPIFCRIPDWLIFCSPGTGGSISTR